MGFSGRESLLVGFLLVLALAWRGAFAVDVGHDGRAITIDGQRKILISGSIHYPRSTPQMWPDLIKKAKEGGLDAIESYVFWNGHEPVRRQYDFSGNLDLIRFIKTIQSEGLYSVLRIGPYVCAEWNYGGFPVWLHNMPGINEFRTVNSVYLDEMQNFTTLIVDMLKKEKLFASQGGPIILAQIENEYGNVMEPYGAAGVAYLDWCANFAESLHIGVPWIMCQQSNAPQPMINTCNGFYCDNFEPNNPNSPKMWTENWTGWFKSWGALDPHRTAEDVAFAVARFFQTGGSFQNYYMYHGGTNFGRSSGPYITTSYDYNAPLNEFGMLNQPKYGHLKQLHDVLHSLEQTLTSGNVSTTDFGNSVTATVYTWNGTSSCFFGNANATADATVTYQGRQYDVAAWSVSILPDCKTEVYNTAKVNTPTYVIVKKPNEAEDEPVSLKWSWLPEDTHDTVVKGKGQISASRLLDQKSDNDVSDYLWYMTSFNLDKDDPVWSKHMSLRVNTTGQVLHAFVNGKYLGSKWPEYGKFNNVFEKKCNLKPGKNQITLLSATVGLQNYGQFFDIVPNGISGPVEIIGRKGDESVTKDLSQHKWTYKAGLKGYDHEFFSSNSSSKFTWKSENVPFNRRFTWYKTTFKAPLGLEPVAVDLQGLGKGEAWVNANSLGRYWPSYIAQDDGCSETCDYRGPYGSGKCPSNCGNPTQRWYHVPRSFLKDGENELVLFEEFGGNPSLVNFQTLVVGTACGSAYENNVMELSCNGRTISAINFASFGDAKGTCGSFEKGSHESTKDALSIVKQACLGKESCSILASESVFGETNSAGTPNRLLVEAVC